MAEKFILERQCSAKQSGKFPTIKVSRETYTKLSVTAAETNLSIAEVANRAIGYAMDNLVYIDIC